jgi:hypothetical protein
MMRSAAAVLLIFCTSIAMAAPRKAPTAPGKYQAWGPDIDEVEIVQSFRLSDYDKVLVEPVSSSTAVQESDADLLDATNRVLANATPSFFAGVKKESQKEPVVVDHAPDGSSSLIIRAKITLMDAGSRSKRIFVGFGAGAARTVVEGEIVDGRTGAVLLRFTQERRSGVERFGRGSSYEEIMKRNLTAIGQDVANLLNVFQPNS